MSRAAHHTGARLTVAEVKANGVHYTPSELAQFLADALVGSLQRQSVSREGCTILDPACGDGELLLALLNALPVAVRTRTRVLGFDNDAAAVAEARRRIASCGVADADIRCEDFLAGMPADDARQLALGFDEVQRAHAPAMERADLIISNPPYVRTQVLGGRQAGMLARQFGLTGRVDLYHAFVIAMTRALKPGGLLGLLTSNRFLSTQAGGSLRAWLLREYSLELLIDLGDTKLFNAAVLPAILVARKQKAPTKRQRCLFRRVYEEDSPQSPCANYRSVLAALSADSSGTVDVAGTRYRIESGVLRAAADSSVPWILSNDATDDWIGAIERQKGGVFADFGEVRVGIKTTADKVFIRDDWESLPADQQPEPALLHPLVTHHAADRWALGKNACGQKRVLYPYVQVKGHRQTVDLTAYPKTGRYLESHRTVLEGRRYVVESGRAWFEIWVPQSPSAWVTPKLAFPDISVGSVFFLCPPGWIVNGDCYWISANTSAPRYALKAMLAVANSSLSLRYYDVMFHNKLYAGRRRFMSQYVARFPFPKPARAAELADAVSHLLAAKDRNGGAAAAEMEEDLDNLVWDSFGLVKET